jgi:hypothetical protein
MVERSARRNGTIPHQPRATAAAVKRASGRLFGSGSRATTSTC